MKDCIVESIEAGVGYEEIKKSLLRRVGKTVRELELELFPPRRRCVKDKVERGREIIQMVERVGMLSNTNIGSNRPEMSGTVPDLLTLPGPRRDYYLSRKVTLTGKR